MKRIVATLALAIVSLGMVNLVVLVALNQPFTVASIEASGVGVYWDHACTSRMTSLDWGDLMPGASQRIQAYVRNEGGHPVFLFLRTTQWTPAHAANYLTCRWNHPPVTLLAPGEIVPTDLILSASWQTRGVSTFSFTILITGSDTLPGDADGNCNVDPIDVFSYLAPAYGTSQGDPAYNSNCDFNSDGTIDPVDVFGYLAPNYGQSCS